MLICIISADDKNKGKDAHKNDHKGGKKDNHHKGGKKDDKGKKDHNKGKKDNNKGKKDHNKGKKDNKGKDHNKGKKDNHKGKNNHKGKKNDHKGKKDNKHDHKKDAKELEDGKKDVDKKDKGKGGASKGDGSGGKATTTRYWDCSGGSCGCGYGPKGKEAHCHSNALFKAPSGNEHGALFYGGAAISKALGGGNWMAKGCGKCWKLTSGGKTIVLKGTNFCPDGNAPCAKGPHFDISAPGFDFAGTSLSNTCSKAEPNEPAL